MNDTVKEWIDKAERDLATARRELAAVEQPNYDAVCFHAQQCSVAFRYPGESADWEEAAQAFNIATRLREKLLLLLKEA